MNVSKAAVALALASLACGRARADRITPEMLRDDPRLATTVSLASEDISISELTAQLAARAHITVASDDRDPAAQEHLAVFLRDVPLGDAMNALWSLMSYRRAEWLWSRQGTPGAYRYVLVRPLAARRFAEGLVNWMQDTFEAQAALLEKAALLSPEQRAAFIHAHVADLFWPAGDPTDMQLKVDRFWDGLVVFQECLSPEARLAVLRGAQVPPIPVSSLSERGRSFVRAEWERAHATRSLGGGRTEPVPMPDAITVFTTHAGGTAAPNLVIQLGQIGGYAYVGGVRLEDAFTAKLESLWNNDGDVSKSPLTDQRIPPAKPGAPPANIRPPFDQHKSTAAPALRQLSERMPLSLIARLPENDGAYPQPMDGKTLRDYLSDLRNRFHLMTKWRGDVLLLSSTTWYMREAALVPQQIVKRLRAAQESGHGLLPLKDLAYAASRLTPAQLDHLSGEIPALQVALRWRELLAPLGESPLLLSRATSDRGLPVTDELRAALRGNATLSKILDQVAWRALRLVVEDGQENGTAFRRIRLDLQAPDASWKRIAGFQYRAKESSK